MRSYRSYNDDARYDEDSDDAYDAAKDEWVPGDEPMNSSQRRENDMLNEEYRRNGW